MKPPSVSVMTWAAPTLHRDSAEHVTPKIDHMSVYAGASRRRHPPPGYASRAAATAPVRRQRRSFLLCSRRRLGLRQHHQPSRSSQRQGSLRRWGSTSRPRRCCCPRRRCYRQSPRSPPDPRECLRYRATTHAGTLTSAAIIPDLPRDAQLHRYSCVRCSLENFLVGRPPQDRNRVRRFPCRCPP